MTLGHRVPLLLACALAGSLPGQWGIATPTPGPSQGPSALRHPTMVYSLFDGTCLLLGTGAFGASEFWRYDGASWTPIPAAPQVPVRGPAVAYDLAAGKLVLYGGVPNSLGPNSDVTLLWNGLQWTAPPTPVSPGGLANHAMTYDTLRGRVVLYGGTDNIGFGGTIRELTWEFDGSTWSVVNALGPGPRERLALCHSLALGQTVLFGGTGPLGEDDETWLFDGTRWQQAPVTGLRPRPRVDARMVDDPVRGVVLLVGGRDQTTFEVLDDTWEFDGTAWRQTSPNVAPRVSPPRSAFGLCFDWGRGRPVLFGGETQTGAQRSDTWEYAAFHQTYGYGCNGSFGRPSLTGGSSPVLGGTGSVHLGNLDPTAPFALLAIGRSRTQWAFGSLPASLAFAGMPGCVAYTSADEFRLLAASGGTATWTFHVPGDPGLFGAQVFLQGVSFDPPANAAGAVTSSADMLTLGW